LRLADHIYCTQDVLFSSELDSHLNLKAQPQAIQGSITYRYHIASDLISNEPTNSHYHRIKTCSTCTSGVAQDDFKADGH